MLYTTRKGAVSDVIVKSNLFMEPFPFREYGKRCCSNFLLIKSLVSKKIFISFVYYKYTTIVLVHDWLTNSNNEASLNVMAISSYTMGKTLRSKPYTGCTEIRRYVSAKSTCSK